MTNQPTQEQINDIWNEWINKKPKELFSLTFSDITVIKSLIETSWQKAQDEERKRIEKFIDDNFIPDERFRYLASILKQQIQGDKK